MFVKSIVHSVKRKVGEPLLILVTVMLAVAVFIAALSLRSSVETRLLDTYRSLAGRADYEASFSEDYAAYFATEDSEEYRRLQESAEKYGTLHSGYRFALSVGRDRVYARAYSTDIKDLMEYNDVIFLVGAPLEMNSGAIFSATYAEKAGVHIGDLVELSVYGAGKKTVEVIALAADSGPFLSVDVLLTDVTAARLLSLSEDVKIRNRFFIELSEDKMKTQGVTTEQAKAAVEGDATAFTLDSPLNDEDIGMTLRYESMLLYVIAALVAALGAILIYTAVTLVMKNRLSLVALFRSVGASTGGIFLYLIAEVALYGILGSLLGVAASYGISALMNVMLGSASAPVTISFLTAFFGVLFGLALALVSAVVPVWKVSAMPLYDMLSASSPIVKRSSLPAIVAGVLLLGFVLWSAFATVTTSFIVGVVTAILLLVFLFLAIPSVVKAVGTLVMKCTAESTCGTLYVAASGARENRHTQSGARLLCIALTAVIAVASLCGEAAGQLSKADSLFRADIMISASAQDLSSIQSEVRTETDAEGAYLAFIETKCSLAQGTGVVTFIAVRNQEAADVLNVSSFDLDLAALRGTRRLAMGRGLAMKLGLDVGDTVTVKVAGEERAFTVGALLDTPLAFVFSDLSGLGIDANTCLVRSSSDTLAKDLSERYARIAAVYRARELFSSLSDMARAYIRVFILLDVIVILFAAVGYVNNALASYRDRKREYELLNGVGAGRAERLRIILSENALVALSAVIVGVLSSVLLLFLVQNMLRTFGLYFSLLG